MLPALLYFTIMHRKIESLTQYFPFPPAIGDLDGDGSLEVAYAVVWGGADTNTYFAIPPRLVVRAFTLEDRFTEVYGEKKLEFSRFLPSDQQPWTHYMGATGDGVFRLHR